MCRAHAKIVGIGKPFDWIVKLWKLNIRNAQATRYIVDVAIELEPVNAGFMEENDVRQMSCRRNQIF